MSPSRSTQFALSALLLALATSPSLAQQGTTHWYKGNTHAHTLNSDGDSPPDVVARWYREHGYQFTFITDHEFITDVAPLNALLGASERFLVMSAQEVTQRVADAAHPDGVRQAHVNALGLTKVIRPVGERNIATGMTIADTYRRNLPAIRAAGAIPQVNHPNFRWSVTLEQMADLPDSTIFEIWNGHPTVYNLGGTDSSGSVALSTEALWDSLLSRGKLLFGVADDDSHHFRPQDAENEDMARPGRGWIMVRADTLSPQAILRSISRGEFYSSNGVVLRDVRTSAGEYRIDIAPAGDARYLVEFIGRGGRMLASSTSMSATYRVQGNEGYVRGRVTDSRGRRAWTQPIRVGR